MEGRIVDSNPFGFSEQIVMMNDMLARFVESELPNELVAKWDKNNEFPADIHTKLAALGLMGLTVPEEYGGSGLDILATINVIERLCGRSMSVGGGYINSACYAGLNLVESGSERQKQELLPRVAQEGLIFAYGLTEPDVGSDLASVKTTGKKDGQTVIINGAKRFCSGAGVANYIYTLVRTGPVEDRRRNLSIVLVPPDARGVTLSSQDTMGLKGMGTYDVSFDDVSVPLENVLGEEAGWNNGWSMLVGPGLDIEKLEVSAMALGIASAAVDEAWTYAEQRIQFGQRISAIQSIRHMLADAKTKLHACRLMTYHAARLVDQRQPASVETSMTKLFVCDTARDIVLTCQQVMGAYGYAKDFNMERLVRDILVMPILGGSSAIQKNNIANRLNLAK